MSQIHAFEIVPDTYKILTKSVRQDLDIITNCIGLSERKESIVIHVSSKDSLVSTANKIEGMKYHDDYYDSKLTCEVTTGRAYLEDQSIKKIDF